MRRLLIGCCGAVALAALFCLLNGPGGGSLAQGAHLLDTGRLVFAGDVMIGRTIGRLLDRYGPDYAFRQVEPLLTEADLAFGNLESPLTTAPYVRSGYNLVSDPARVSSLTLGGFDVVALANNHVTDHGADGLKEIIETLDGAGIAHVGAGRTITEAHQYWVGQAGPVTVAYLAYDATWGSRAATADSPGSAYPEGAFLASIAQARQAADLVVVSVHWGEEYRAMPGKYQRGLARSLAGAGADIIAGHHPHVVQPVEWIAVPGRDRPTLVAYSLGNFIFDQEFSAETSESALLACDVSKQGLRAAWLVPLHIRRGQVLPVSSQEGEAVLYRLLHTGYSVPSSEVFVSRRLPDGKLDFQLMWYADSVPPAPAAALTTDVDGDGRPDRLGIGEGRACVQTAEDRPAWCVPPQWQVQAAALDDVDGDGRAELVTLAQQNEEAAPAAGNHVRLWKWDAGQFVSVWRSLPGTYRDLWLAEADGSGPHAIVAGTGPR